MKEKITQLIFKKEWTLPKTAVFEEAIKKFSTTEKTIFCFFAGLLTLSAVISLNAVSNAFLVTIPNRGGTLTEGVIGTPRFINPLLAISDADRDLTALVYSGLLKATSAGGLVPDLAKSYSISNDGLQYDFILKDNVVFQDGKPVTADDVVFTIQKAEDPALKSPRRANWEGVKAAKISDKEVKLILKQPYAPFLENATMGILPKHIWKDVDAEQFPFSSFNVLPIGSGPYKVKTVERNANGAPIYYELSPFVKYSFGEPHVSRLIFRFYGNNNGLLSGYKNGDIQSMNGLSPEEAASLKASGDRVERTPLPRVFAVFFNQNQNLVLSRKEVRQALDVALDKQNIVEKILAGYGIPIGSPIPPGLIDDKNSSADGVGSEPMTAAERIDAARKILEKNKWTWNADKKLYEKKNKKDTAVLAFSISTSNAPELKEAAETIKDTWNAVGAKVDVKVFEMGEFNQNVIRARKYDALFFGEIIGRDLDLFAFWHSSQRNDPGLNIALYTNSKADKLLEDARTITEKDKRAEKYQLFEQEIKNDIPAVFIYSPDFLYVLPKNLNGFFMDHITVPAERFLTVEKWYMETEKVWGIFAPKESVSGE